MALSDDLTKTPVCPYCNEVQSRKDWDIEIADGDFGNYECRNCGKTFKAEPIVLWRTKRVRKQP